MRSAMKWIERCLWAIGLAALAVWLGVWLSARQQQAEGNRELDRQISVATAPSALPVKLGRGYLIGRIEIPRLRISTVIFEGTDEDVLRIGAGHMPGSPLPGESGNVVVAAHRDTFFRPLRNIHTNDDIAIVTSGGTRRYRVDSIEIVTPDRTDVLGKTQISELTLVTCYPFEWFGHAPKRFIVRAHELESGAAASL